MEECIFCKIAQDKIDSEKIYENENTVSFLDINPRAPGHSLVIPKKHVKNLINLDDEIVSELFKVTKKVEKLLKSSIEPDAFTIGINEGEEAGQEISHLHVNIIPRFKRDGGGPVQSVVKNPPKKEISKIGKMIRESLKINKTHSK
ncbi:hypothetical protein AKJ51_03315 [candidate division MSBL1 archaeon SCGC-AAA382A20]|uniref:HIT domain-containing protein n=1 Tax=candidate division MSBL1 archaeon SCGC-AAA382A20 TaxID=1698280 RepID=A0A133VJM3_9EURY|nr:hypothetical protein AKJ51_03315 [candidate division MSBL1 archaeon SCGC-AAA382A20]